MVAREGGGHASAADRHAVGSGKGKESGAEEAMATVVLKVPDISCEQCERIVTRALAPLAGVRGVSVDIPAKQVRVTYDEALIDVERMKEVLRTEDYPVTSAEPAR